ncbi:protein of unknown function [Candidatus Filomicrobium marinum]|uniref:Uncharacterized protein n=2 Tax=Hyphomicrobiaceae TaxID=45401 RepID=A0A0D6JIV5_9HYPH|nr:protein of unknown function [Candidatus Filomicrobium marinum]CPR21881.1 protein of unknown function [Candidatus Filomicrobium marinum]
MDTAQSVTLTICDGAGADREACALVAQMLMDWGSDVAFGGADNENTRILVCDRYFAVWRRPLMARILTFVRSFGVLVALVGFGASVTLADDKPEFSEQGFLSAAYDNCATVENRNPKSCECEQKLMSDPDRMSLEDKQMAFYYWRDKERYIKEFEAKRTADPKWQEAFALRMAQVQALIIAACGV